MGIMSYFFLPILAWFRASSQSTNPVSNDGAVETPEAALLQEEADLESAHVGSPQLEHETASEPAEAEAPDQDAVTPTGLSTPNLQPLATANQPSGVTMRQPPVAGREYRVPIREAWTRTDRRSSTKLKEHLRLSFLEITTASGVLINLFYIRRATEPVSENPSLIVASASAFVSLLSGFGLMLDSMRQLMSRANLPRSWSKHLLCLSIMSLAFTVVALIASFLPKTYYYMPVVLVPTLPAVTISFYHLRPRDDVGGGGDGGDDPHKADRKRLFQLAINMTTFSFMGALGALIGYHRNSPNRADHVYVKVAIYLMFGASLTGLVTLLLNRMLRSWKDWKKTAAANAIMLGLLVPAVLMVATTFLGGAVATATAFPVAIGAATWYVMELHFPDYGQQEDELLKPLYPVALTAMSVSFGAVMAIFAGFLGGEAKGKNLEVCIFFVVSCFVSSVSLGLITFRTPKKASLGEAAKALGYLTLVLLVLAALALVSYVGS